MLWGDTMRNFKGLTASLTASVAPIALALGSPVAIAESGAEVNARTTASWGDIYAFAGEAQPQWGDIYAFDGSASPQWGDIYAFWGDIYAFNGEAKPSWGDIYAFSGGASPQWGDIYAFGGGANASWGDIYAFGGKANPNWGDIYAFWGDIYAFEGEAKPSWGDIYAFGGDAQAKWGDIYAFNGAVNPQWGDIYAFWGDIYAFEGKADPSWGDIYAFWGDIYAFEGDAAAQWGDIYAFDGAAQANWGDIYAFWGDIYAFDGEATPRWGDIYAFGGNAAARWGDIYAFGDARAQWGDIYAFDGAAKPHWGDIYAFWGDIYAFEGEAAAQWGDIYAFDGAAQANWGDIYAFWGDIYAFDGEATPNWGDIYAFDGDAQATWGDIYAFWGDIYAFHGKTAPNWGDIYAFEEDAVAQWGDIYAFWGDIYAFGGDLQAQWGDIYAFQGDAEASWGDIYAFWGDLTQLTAQQQAYSAVQSKMQGLVDQSAAFWGDKVMAQTGQDFWNGFAANIFAKHGIDLNDPSTLADMSDIDRLAFMFDWNDGLMQFSGLDQADYWMNATNWSPGLSYMAGAGAGTVIGLVDFQLTDSAELGDRLLSTGGYDMNIHGHGSAVASLIAAGHDGQGVMGIAPGAQIAAYNPFDETATAGWEDIGLGVMDVLGQGASVVNMSLGVPDSTFHPEWFEVYGQQSIIDAGKNAIFVHAAGNEGFAQTEDINWDAASALNMVVVGSVGPTGQISSFSNTPGSACFLVDGSCLAGNALMNRFIVAPGEWLLVADGEGGVTRKSGTSFATPMVTGAVALLHNRWGWLKDHPTETVDILFRTATDLGDAGIDSTYGHGLLNIAASQSPLNVANLYQLAPGAGGSTYKTPLAFAHGGEDLMWRTGGAVMPVYEDIGATFRDFGAPVDAMLTGTRTLTGDPTESLQTFLHDSFSNWLDASTAAPREASLANPYGWDMRMSVSQLPYGTLARREGLPFATEISMTSPDEVTFRFGRGHGAEALQGFSAIGSGAFDPRTGGLNPVLGLASGGGFAKAEIPVGETTRFDVGFTERQFESLFFLPFSGEERFMYNGVDPYRAMAVNATVTQELSDKLNVTAGYTYLNERDGLLGVQSLNPAGFSAGAQTDAVTAGLSWTPTPRLQFGGSATVARTRGHNSGEQLFAVDNGGIVNTAFEASMSVNGVFGKSDRAHFAIVQPLHIEQGALNYTSLEVTDRDLGVIGAAQYLTPLDNRARELAFEAYYSVPVMDGQGSVAGFLRAEAESSDDLGRDAEHLIGAQFRFGF